MECGGNGTGTSLRSRSGSLEQGGQRHHTNSSNQAMQLTAPRFVSPLRLAITSKLQRRALSVRRDERWRIIQDQNTAVARPKPDQAMQRTAGSHGKHDFGIMEDETAATRGPGRGR